MKFLFFIIFLLPITIFSQLNLSIVETNIDDEYHIYAECNLKYMGNNIIPNRSDLLVIERNFAQEILEFEEKDTTFVLRWKPNYSVIRDPKNYTGNLICNYLNFVSSIEINFFNINIPRIILTTPLEGQQIKTLNFGSIEPGKRAIRQINLRTNSDRMVNGNTISTRVDSITTNTSVFNVTWDGRLGSTDWSVPPTSIIPQSNYLITFTFEPEEDKPYSDVFTVHYDDGAKATLILTGNNLDIKSDDLEQFYNILEPNGGEKLSPCFDYNINWEGGTAGFETQVRLSLDSGKTWEDLGATTKIEYEWNVPTDTSSQALIRINQDFNALSKQTQSINNDLLMLKYSNTDKMIQLYENRQITVENYGNYIFGNSVSSFKYLGTGFINDENFVVGIKDNNKFGIKDSILVFRLGIPAPIASIPSNVTDVQYIKVDENSNSIWLLQEYGRKLFKYNIDGISDSVEFDEPISHFSISKNTDLISAISYLGTIYILNKQNLEIIKTIQIEATPYAVNSAISNDGKFLAIGGKKNDVVNERAFIFLMDIESETIFEIFETGASDPLDMSFSPNSSMLVIVSSWSPVMLVWDLVRGFANTGFGAVSGEVLSGSFASSENTIALSTTNPKELTKFRIMFPLEDISDNTFSILNPELKYDSIYTTEQIIFTKDSVYYQNEICNTGEVDFNFTNFWFRGKKDYDIKFDKYRDTLSPGECISFTIYLEPQDIGILDDTLSISDNCTQTLDIPISGEGLPRSVSYFENEYNFGTICISDTITRSINLIENLDIYDLNITGYEFVESDGYFSINNFTQSILNQNEILNFEFSVSPLFAGKNTTKLRLYFNNQNKYYIELNLSIDGIGAELEASHSDIPFILEEGNRILTIKNQFDKEIKLLGYDFIPNEGYSLVSQLPNTIQPGETIELELSWDGVYEDKVRLLINADPCPIANNFILSTYKSTAFISIPDVTASSPSAEVDIPILVQENPEINYNGDRNFNASISLNPRLFFPLEVNSKFGEASLISSSVKNDVRIIEVNAFGNYALHDTVLVIKGVAGIAETDFTEVKLEQNDSYFGESTRYFLSNGSLKIDGLLEDRRIIHTYNLQIQSISPNPISNNTNVFINSNIEDKARLILRDLTGNEIKTYNVSLQKGMNEFNYKLNDLSSGTYYFELIYQNKFIQSYSINIVK